MPYRGKPSKGCQTCRARKIRCDQRKGGCINCEKSNRVCSGYRDQLDLMFLDETKSVESKARRGSQGPSRTAQTTPESIEQAVDPPLKKNLSAGDVPKTLTTDLESQATIFFFEHFTIERNADRMSEMYTSTSPTDKPGSQALIHSIRALGLACLSRGGETPQLLRLAESQYLDAIRAMNSALSDADEAKKDNTLLAVMILTIFETFTNNRNQNLVAWGNHIQGAAALLEARGKEQFQSKEGLRLFVQAAVPICANCMQLNIPLPGTIFSLMAEALRVSDPDDTAILLLDHKLRFVSFYTKVKSHEITDFAQIVQQAKQLDDEIVLLLNQIKEPWTYSTIPVDFNEHTFLGYCYVFEHFLAAECWNGAWVTRILLNQMIRSVLLLGFASRPPIFTDEGHTMLFQEATNNLFQIQHDVVATVPQYLGYLPSIVTMNKGKGKQPMFPGAASTQMPMGGMTPRPLSRTPTPNILTAASITEPFRFFWTHFSSMSYGFSTSMPSPERSTLPIIRTTGGANLPWILYLLATTDIATDKLKTWIDSRLNEIGKEFGVQQSFILAERLRSGNIDFAWYRNLWSTPPKHTPVNATPQTSLAAEIGETDLG